MIASTPKSKANSALLFLLPVLALLCLILACNTKDGSRFIEQEELYRFDSNSIRFVASGASRIDNPEEIDFRCPSASGMGQDSDVTVFYAQANTPTPHFSLETSFGVRSDSADAMGISLTQLPIGLLDIYEICGASNFEKYVTQCPDNFTLVDSCDSNATSTCARIHEGTHQLTIHATVSNEKVCYTEESDRSAYNDSAPPLSFACDEFDSMPVLGVYRGESPSNQCCSINSLSHLDLCIRPCGCRKLTLSITAKPSFVESLGANPALKIAVFANTEGNEKAFEKMLESISSHEVDMIVGLGNTTKSGSAKQWRSIKDKLRTKHWMLDGQECPVEEENLCCDTANVRKYPNICNALIKRLPLILSLGDSDLNEAGLNTFYQLFGPSNISTIIGRTELIVLDTAEAALSSQQKIWLNELIHDNLEHSCTIPSPSTAGLTHWPLLKECIDNGKSSCRECIASEAYCITPDKARSNPEFASQNCICVPITAKYCPHNLTCSREDGIEGECICTRDSDCGPASFCSEQGKCQSPLRLFFSYTPIFDNFGARNTALRSKAEAAELLTLLIKANVSAIFSGKILDYANFDIGSIPVYITGGGGAEMESFSKYGRHWLLLTIPNAWTKADAKDLKVELISF